MLVAIQKNTMKQSEKLDLILKTLYNYRQDGRYFSIEEICKSQNIPVEPKIELRMIVKRLEQDGYIRAIYTNSDISAVLTSHGIEYCEEDSYANKGHSIITNNYNLTITNSPNANIVSSSDNVTILINNYSNIKNKISEIRDTIKRDTTISQNRIQDIIDCIDEVETAIDSGKKPKFSFSSLVELTSNIAGIGSLVIELGELISGIQ